MKPGVNHGTFDIVVDKPWFNVSDIIQPEDNRYRFRVMEGSDGSRRHRRLGVNQYQYRLQVISNDPAKFCPRKFIEENAEWCKVSSAVANEANQDFGGFQFYSIFQSEGLVQQHAVKIELTDKAARKAKLFAEGDKSQHHDDFGRLAESTKMLWTSIGRPF